MNNLATRSVTATGFVIVMVGTMLLGPIASAVLFLIVTYLCIEEYIKLSATTGAHPDRFLTLMVGVSVYIVVASTALFQLDVRFIALILPLMLLLMIAEMYHNKLNPFTNISWMVLAVVYIAIPFALLIHFFNVDGEGWKERSGLILSFFVILWLNDTGAYFVGSLTGKHKLFERISPKKSWEGSIGGGIIALLTAWGLSFLFVQYSLLQWFMIALVIIVFGTLGDLVESMLKRSVGVKDSGNMLPGHGGVLDRFDAVLLASPMVYLLINFIN